MTLGNLPAALEGLLSSDEELLSKSLAHFIQDINEVAENSFNLSSFNQEFGPEARGPENSVELTQSSERHDCHPHHAECDRSCGVSSAHLNYTKHPMIRSVYRFHVYYQVRRVLKRLPVPLPHEASFKAADNPYTESEFLKICEDYGVPRLATSLFPDNTKCSKMLLVFKFKASMTSSI